MQIKLLKQAVHDDDITTFMFLFGRPVTAKFAYIVVVHRTCNATTNITYFISRSLNV